MKFWTKEQCLALGLTDKESKLLRVLKRVESVNTSELAYKASLPRVTAMRILKALKRRRFVTRAERGNKVFWSMQSSAVLEERFATAFKDSRAFHTNKINLSEVGSLTIYRGAEAMLESNRKMLTAHAGERVLAIEPNGIWKHIAQVPAEELEKLNRLFKQKQILIEIVMEDGFEKVITQYADPGVHETFLSLAVDIRVVSAGILDSATEILIFRDQLLFADWAQLVAIEIKNPSTVRVVKAMYRLLQENGREHKL